MLSSTATIYVCSIDQKHQIQLSKKLKLQFDKGFFNFNIKVSPDGEYLMLMQFLGTMIKTTIIHVGEKLRVQRLLQEGTDSRTHTYTCDERWMNGVYCFFALNDTLCAYDPKQDVIYQDILNGNEDFKSFWSGLQNFSAHPGMYFINGKGCGSFMSAGFIKKEDHVFPQPILRLIADYSGLIDVTRESPKLGLIRGM